MAEVRAGECLPVAGPDATPVVVKMAESAMGVVAERGKAKVGSNL